MTSSLVHKPISALLSNPHLYISSPAHIPVHKNKALEESSVVCLIATTRLPPLILLSPAAVVTPPFTLLLTWTCELEASSGQTTHPILVSSRNLHRLAPSCTEAIPPSQLTPENPQKWVFTILCRRLCRVSSPATNQPACRITSRI